MKKWFLLSLLLTLSGIAGETASTDSILQETPVVEQEMQQPLLAKDDAEQLVAAIKDEAQKLSFYVDIKKSVAKPLTAEDLQAAFEEKGITIPLEAINLEAPLSKPSKSKAKAKDLEKVSIDLGNGVSTEVFVEIKEKKSVDTWKMFFDIVGGLAIFLLGMNYMSNGLQTIAGPRLRSMIAAVTNNKWIAVLAGTGVTTLVQSSSVTTVMVVGFVNSGIMTLKQSLGVIFGANIGTTITGWIIALKIGKYGLPMLGIAALIYLFSRKDKLKYISMSIMGLGMVFFGLSLMKAGFAPIKSVPAFEAMFHTFQISELTFFNLNMYKAVLVGAILTMIVQSSSATLGITITLAATGVINFYTAAALVMGENIGTTITAILAALNTNKTARRAALGHMIFNVLGVIWITTIFPWYIHGIEWFFDAIGTGQGSAHPIEAEIALVHSLFNVINVLLFIPFLNPIATLLERIIPGDKNEGTLHITSLHPGTLFESPTLAVEAAKFEIEQMGILCIEIDRQMQEILATERKDITDDMKSNVFNLETKLDNYQKEISEFLMDLSATKSMSHAEAERIQMLFRHADEYESISDYYANILKKGIKLIDGDIKVPAQEKADMLEINKLLGNYIEQTAKAINENDGTQGETLIEESQKVKVVIKSKRKEHLKRLQNEEMSPMFSVSYLDILTSFRQIQEHLLNMGELL